MAPMSDPKITVLVIADSPKGVHFGSVTAGPAVSEILGKSLKYLTIEPDATEEQKDSEKVEIPNVVGQSAEDAIGILAGSDLGYDMNSKDGNDDFVVIKQYPSAGSTVKKGTKVFLYREGN